MSIASSRLSSRRPLPAVARGALSLALLASPTLMPALAPSFARADEPAPVASEVEPTSAPQPATSALSLEELGYKAVDVFPIRFGGALRLVVGSVLLVPASLFSTLSLPFDRNPGVYRDNFDILVAEPFDYTFRRPLGESLSGL